MSIQSTDSITGEVPTVADPFASRLLSHLGDETASFAAMLEAVRGINMALRKLDDEMLAHWLEAERRELVSILDVQQRRQELQEQLGPQLNLGPRDVTLRRLIQATSGSLREAVERGWRLLSEMSVELDRLNKQNAAMIRLSMSIAKGVVERITGMTSIGESYNAVGAKAETHVGPLIQWGG